MNANEREAEDLNHEIRKGEKKQAKSEDPPSFDFGAASRGRLNRFLECLEFGAG
jgi:hypothetical protein